MNHPIHILSAAGLVSRPDGKVLLVKSPCRGWEYPGGQVEMGESAAAGALREILEESGITARVTHFVGAYTNLGSEYNEAGELTKPPILNLTFLCEYLSGEPRVSDETTEVGWFTREEAQKLVTFPAFVKRLYDMLHFNGEVCFAAFRRHPGEEREIEWIEDLRFPSVGLLKD